MRKKMMSASTKCMPITYSGSVSLLEQRVGQQVEEHQRADDQPQDALLVLRVRARGKPRAQLRDESGRRGGRLRHQRVAAASGSLHWFWISVTSLCMPRNASTMRGSKCRPDCERR